jgi:hypothetical protein
MTVHRAPRTPGHKRPPVTAGKAGDQPVLAAMKIADQALKMPASAMTPMAPMPQGGAGS